MTRKQNRLKNKNNKTNNVKKNIIRQTKVINPIIEINSSYFINTKYNLTRKKLWTGFSGYGKIIKI